MDGWLQKDAVVRVVALVLAFVMWLFVVNEQNPQDTRIISVLPELRNIPAGMVLAEDIKPVSVRLRGRRNDLYAIGASEISLFADLAAEQKVRKPIPSGLNLCRTTFSLFK